MLAECGIVENLTESLREQSLDDFTDLSVLESLGHCGKSVNFSPNFSRGETTCSSVILKAERPHTDQTRKSKNSRNKSIPLAKPKIHKTSKETDLELQLILPEQTKSKIKSTEHLDVDSKREMLSSSEEELSELYVKNKVCIPSNGNIQYLMTSGVHFGASEYGDGHSSGTGQSCQNQQDLLINRKRFKQPGGKSKIVKKIKLSRPSLDLDKMQATRLRCDKHFVLKNGNIFSPIDAT